MENTRNNNVNNGNNDNKFNYAIDVLHILNSLLRKAWIILLVSVLSGAISLLFTVFFISRHYPPSLPVYSIVQKYVPYPWCAIIYFVGFSLASYIILIISRGIIALVKLARRPLRKA